MGDVEANSPTGTKSVIEEPQVPFYVKYGAKTLGKLANFGLNHFV
jgi:hypothetical protein